MESPFRVANLMSLSKIGCRYVASGLALVFVSSVQAADSTKTEATQKYSVGEVIEESLFGDVYAHPENWEELGLSDLLSKGWDKPWTSPPTGAGYAPRHGWLNAYDGVFYRLSLGIFGWQHHPKGDDGYSGSLYSYTSLSERFELQSNIPFVNSSASFNDPEHKTRFGDLMLGPTVMLSETRAVSQSLLVAFRIPTGNNYNGNGIAAISPTYQFWANWWEGLVVRGGAGFSVPYAGNLQDTGVRSTFNSNLAVGYYFTNHDFTPLGDLVWYVSGNFSQTLDNRGPTSVSTFSLGPGFRTHLGDNWFLLGSVDMPVTRPEPYDYQVLGSLMKVY